MNFQFIPKEVIEEIKLYIPMMELQKNIFPKNKCNVLIKTFIHITIFLNIVIFLFYK